MKYSITFGRDIGYQLGVTHSEVCDFAAYCESQGHTVSDGEDSLVDGESNRDILRDLFAEFISEVQP